jgi:hypothetical protein
MGSSPDRRNGQGGRSPTISEQVTYDAAARIRYLAFPVCIEGPGLMKKQTDISHMDRRTLLFTPDLIESFVNCRYKAYLKLAGQHGVISDFEAMVIERKDRVRTSLAQKLESRCGLHGVADGRQTTEASTPRP